VVPPIRKYLYTFFCAPRFFTLKYLFLDNFLLCVIPWAEDGVKMKVTMETVLPHMWVIRIKDTTFGDVATPLKKKLVEQFSAEGFGVNPTFPVSLADGWFYHTISVSHRSLGSMTLFLLKNNIPEGVSIIHLR
jgi:hypothetical protein